MSTIAAGTTSGTALVSTGNTAGTLVFQTNGTTTALTLGTDQSATFVGAVTAPSFSGTSSTATNLAGGSNGTIPYQSAAGTTQMLAVGTPGQLLQTNGAGAPSWVSPSSGALVYLSATTASGVSSVDIESGISSTYDDYIIFCDNLTVDTNATYLYMQNKVGGSYRTSSYKYQLEYTDTANATQYNEVASGGITNGVKASYYMTNSSGSYSNVTINLRGVNTSNYQVVTSQVNGYSASDRGRGNVSYGLSEAASGTLTGVKVLISSGTLTGVFKLYGIAKS